MDRYLIEYAGIIGLVKGSSFGFQPLEDKLVETEKAAAEKVIFYLDGEFIQKIRVTKFNVKDGTCRDVTEDVMQWISELYDWEFDVIGRKYNATGYPSILETFAGPVSKAMTEAA